MNTTAIFNKFRNVAKFLGWVDVDAAKNFCFVQGYNRIGKRFAVKELLLVPFQVSEVFFKGESASRPVTPKLVWRSSACMHLRRRILSSFAAAFNMSRKSRLVVYMRTRALSILRRMATNANITPRTRSNQFMFTPTTVHFILLY
jgi:hypothetical protein